MARSTARHSGIEIAYEAEGPASGEPLLLIMGLGLSMAFWPESFRRLLVERGFRVARFGNRDVGGSTRLIGLGQPSPLAFAARRWSGYRLTDMADDATAVLDALGWTSGHVAGVSLGGMIAQTLAGRHPDRARTLTSLSSHARGAHRPPASPDPSHRADRAGPRPRSGRTATAACLPGHRLAAISNRRRCHPRGRRA
jgi:pimeloyl-ACP methyl ester carboxylesterase